MDAEMIAPEPVSAANVAGAERKPRVAAVAASDSATADASGQSSGAQRGQLADVLPPLPPPPDPPGTAYVAAVLSGALSPKPVTPQQVYQRTGEWTPPDSPLHLADKTI